MRKISYSELILLNNGVLENVDRLAALGATRVELMMDAAGWDAWQADYSKLIPELKKRPIHYSVHPAAWDINLTAEMKILRDAALEHHFSALRFTAELGANQMVLHPGFAYSPCFSKATARKRAQEAGCRLAEEAKKLGVRLAWENVGYNGASIYTYEEYKHSLDNMDDSISYLIDIGHAHVNGWNVPQLIRDLKGRLAGLHIHDNNGKGDQHLPIACGNQNWDELAAAMREIQDPDCEFILEYAPGLPLDYLAKGTEFLKQI
ncbi:MAG: sugar phosphate isomerase/epimerase [Clostridia bacterium]|nr:sugar phosphate isomerase/epimerase [Clostridia bacterium]